MNKDLTVGKPSRVLWSFCLPLFGSVIFQQLYNLADSLVAGKFIGENALASVGNSYEVTLIFIAFAFGCNIGTSVIASLFFGAKDYRQLKTGISTALLFSAALSLVLMVLGLLLCTPLLLLLHTPEELMADSALYLRVYLFGLPFLFLYNLSTGVFSALGDSRTPFLFLAFSSSANILVDILFVTAFKMGVMGVALATFLCQGLSCILALLAMRRRLAALPHSDAPLFSASLLRRILVIAIPSTLQQSFISIGNLVLQGLINGFGPGVIAGYSASVKLNNLVITSFTTLGNGVSNYTAQNLGAGKNERIREGFFSGLCMIWALGIPLAFLYFFFGEPLVRFFMNDPSASALQTGILFLRILSPFYPVVAAKLIADGILRGSGSMKAFMSATFTDLLLRVGMAFLLSRTSLGSTGIWCAWPVGWCIATLLSLSFYGKDWGFKKAPKQTE